MYSPYPDAGTNGRSYAGLFAYDQQTPMKTFQGDVPCVPLTALVADRQGGAQRSAVLTPRDVGALREIIGVDVLSCSGKCSPEFWDCLGASQEGAALSDRLGTQPAQACIRETLMCYDSCKARRP